MLVQVVKLCDSGVAFQSPTCLHLDGDREDRVRPARVLVHLGSRDLPALVTDLLQFLQLGHIVHLVTGEPFHRHPIVRLLQLERLALFGLLERRKKGKLASEAVLWKTDSHLRFLEMFWANPPRECSARECPQEVLDRNAVSSPGDRECLRCRFHSRKPK